MESIYQHFQDLIGEGNETLTLWQILLRAVLVFIITIIIIRLSDRRAYSLLSPFENVIVFLHGALLGRIILDPSIPFLPAVAAAALISLLHRIVAMLSIRSQFFGSLIKDKPVELYRDGIQLTKNMKKVNISEDDLLENVRKNANLDSLEKVKSATLERSGNISFVLKEEEQ
jgi:uncharacterized membrane protein YcaP (DUF421 family)